MTVEEDNSKLSLKAKRIISITVLVVVVAAAVATALAIMPTLLSIVEDPESFRRWVQERGFGAKLAMIAMMTLKVILPIIPGKPFEIGAGYAFGAVEGTVLCIVGAALGSYIVFALVRVFGVRVFNLFYPREKLLAMKFLQDTERLSVWMFFIMLIPGTPKDFLSYFAGLTNMKFSTWLVISPIARIPVVIMATLGGNALGTQDYTLALVVFVISVLISVIGLAAYNRIRKSR
ncbi:MAG: TVP38/TMEM64 family protein [Raoultibacter sp.]|jgi:uncharacterized membrane protein YdjX (TVP38/TMEM64 family)